MLGRVLDVVSPLVSSLSGLLPTSDAENRSRKTFCNVITADRVPLAPPRQDNPPSVFTLSKPRAKKKISALLDALTETESALLAQLQSVPSVATTENREQSGRRTIYKVRKEMGKTTRGRSCPSLFSNGMGRPRADSLSLSSLFTLCQRLATRTLCRARIPSFHSWEDVSRFYAMEELWRGLDVILRFDGWRRRPRRRMTLAAYIAPVHACMHGASSPCIALLALAQSSVDCPHHSAC